MNCHPIGGRRRVEHPFKGFLDDKSGHLNRLTSRWYVNCFYRVYNKQHCKVLKMVSYQAFNFIDLFCELNV
jgi:hypothetical protein